MKTKSFPKAKAAKQLFPLGHPQNTNLIIDDLKMTFGKWPEGFYPDSLSRAIICNNLKAVICRNVGVSWLEIENAVRFLHSHVPAAKIAKYRREFSPDGKEVV